MAMAISPQSSFGNAPGKNDYQKNPASAFSSENINSSQLKNKAIFNLHIEHLKNYYAYKSKGLDHRLNVYKWQLWSSKLIFFTVLILVLAGIIFAGIQFRNSLIAHASSPPLPLAEKKGSETTTDLQQPNTPLDTSIKASTTGFEIKSSIMGITILMISFMFFYLYLKYVFPIRFPTQEAHAVKKSSSFDSTKNRKGNTKLPSKPQK
ncbi:MAG: hypothetical protein OEZ01_17310 [Candidatus Heimdallarchaeota archaeon]|nr:hypothetical protein [Candidatus Heimdallarchaeota archaeon]